MSSRSIGVFQRLAAGLASRGITPNQISMASIGFALLSGGAFMLARAGQGWCFILAALGIQLRLIANMIDGMVAVEGGKGTPTGGLYNEVPDRIADSLILTGAGCIVADMGEGLILGLAASLVAMMTAYIRALGASMAVGQCFLGPMAKPHRMFLLTVACLMCALSLEGWESSRIMTWSLWIVIAGGLLTCVRRLLWISGKLRG